MCRRRSYRFNDGPVQARRSRRQEGPRRFDGRVGEGGFQQVDTIQQPVALLGGVCHYKVVRNDDAAELDLDRKSVV